MQIYHGKGVCKGMTEGVIRVLTTNRAIDKTKKEQILDVDKEWLRYENAVAIAIEQLQMLYKQAIQEIGAEQAAIFETHQILLKDVEYTASVRTMIQTQHWSAEFAIRQTVRVFEKLFDALDDDYMCARIADVKDVSERLLTILQGKISQDEAGEQVFDNRVIIVAEDLTPSQTMQLDKAKVVAFVTRQGSVHSHTAILAKTMGIPAVVQTDIDDLDDLDGKCAWVDGEKGICYVEPEEIKVQLQEQYNLQKQQEELLLQLKGKEDITLDGRKIRLYANIGDIADLELAIKNDAQGIGLFRTECIFLNRTDFPTEQEQFEIYKKVVEGMQGKQVIIRTLDVGADKKTDYFEMEDEENPALGYRAIRFCLTRRDIFKTQLSAILRASVFGKVAIMYPMIISVKEVQQIKALLKEVCQELEKENIPFGNPMQGIMIETPAAALISDELAKEVDFFSIGTNDLTQYTLALDRQNVKLEEFYDAHHPAVMRLIQIVIENAHREGITVGICGELGADITMTREFLCMGIDELSVSPSQILPIRKLVREMNVG